MNKAKENLLVTMMATAVVVGVDCFFFFFLEVSRLKTVPDRHTVLKKKRNELLMMMMTVTAVIVNNAVSVIASSGFV